MTVYYLSPAGSDAASGTSTVAAWKTITRLNTACSNGTVVAGDYVLLQRGQTFYGKVRPPTALDPTGSLYFTIGAYGPVSAARPIVNSYKLLNTAAGWTAYDATTWQIDIGDANAGITHTGYDGVQGGGTNVGFLKVGGVIYGNRKFTLAELAAQWDFYCSGNVLYVRSTANPTTLAADVQASTDTPCISLQSAVRVTGVKVQGSGGHGMKNAGGPTYSKIRVDDCEFAELGGSLLTGTTRYGNGLEFWANTSDAAAERNIFHDIYDVAFTLQGPTSAAVGGSWSNVAFRQNLIYRCNQSLEFWYNGTSSSTNGYLSCTIEYNTCLFAGYAWSSDVRPDQTTRVHLLTYGWTSTVAGLSIRRNVFYDGRGAYRYSDSVNPPVGMTCSANLILQRPRGLLKVGDPRAIEASTPWTAAVLNDLDSQFVVLPASSVMAISDADVSAAVAYLDTVPARVGQVMAGAGGTFVVPIHGIWRGGW